MCRFAVPLMQSPILRGELRRIVLGIRVIRWVFGAFVQATIRHRIQDGKNTSWALVTMADTASVDRALVCS